MNNIHLICNPTSGKGSANATLERIKEWLKLQNNFNVQIHLTENIGHATIITQDLTSGAEPVTILVLGGDGTLSEVLNGIKNFETTTVGLLPFGSGNDFAVALGFVAPDPVALLNYYITNPISKPIDYLLINDKYRAINAAGVGMSAEVIGYRNRMKHFSPKMQYKIASFVRALFWKKCTYTLTLDDKQPETIETVWLTFNNGVCVGSGLTTAPDSSLDDGLISVTNMRTFNRCKTLPYLSKIKKGKIAHLPCVTRYTAKSCILEGNDFVLEYDGNLIEHQTKVNIKIVEKKLNFLMPKK